MNRNLTPHAEALLAMVLWSEEYAAQSGGCMDFWDGLSASRKALCADLLDKTLKAIEQNGRAARPLYRINEGSQP